VPQIFGTLHIIFTNCLAKQIYINDMKHQIKGAKIIINVNFVKNGKRFNVVILRPKKRDFRSRTQRGH
jgi:hypothetical protein